MTKRIGSIHIVIAAAAIAAVPAFASAQSEGQEGQQQQEQDPGQGRGQQRQQQEKTGAKKMNLNEKFSFAVANGCQYTANVNGTITPAKGGGGAQQKGQQPGQAQPGQAQPGQAQHVTADLRVNTQLSCPGKATVRIDETAKHTGPMTPEALEEELERRATILVAEPGRRCAIAPDFHLTSQQLTGVGVAYMCAVSQPQGQGQGTQ